MGSPVSEASPIPAENTNARSTPASSSPIPPPPLESVGRGPGNLHEQQAQFETLPQSVADLLNSTSCHTALGGGLPFSLPPAGRSPLSADVRVNTASRERCGRITCSMVAVQYLVGLIIFKRITDRISRHVSWEGVHPQNSKGEM